MFDLVPDGFADEPLFPSPEHKTINGETYCVYADGSIWRLRDGMRMELCLDGFLAEMKPSPRREVEAMDWPTNTDPVEAMDWQLDD